MTAHAGWAPRSGLIGIFRLCVRCRAYRSIDQFKQLGRVCQPCMDTHVATHGNAGSRARSLVLTDKGRAALREIGVAA